MRRAEARAREMLELSEDLQMERASLEAWRVFCEFFPEADRFVVLCGPGANGGDGLALARHAQLNGLHPIIRFPGKLPDPASLAGLQLRRLEHLGIMPAPPEDIGTLPEGTPFVDALFGTGLSRPLSGVFAEAALQCSQHPGLAIDIPSGLDGRTGQPLGTAVKAKVTVTFGRAKPGLLLSPGREYTGELRVADIGIPPEAWEDAEELTILDDEWAGGQLPPRTRGAHKGTAGKAVLFTGSDAYRGAAVLAGSAALRSGAGLITIASAPSVASSIAWTVPETMGRIVLGPEAEPWGQILSKASAVLAGPGIGQSEKTADALAELLAVWDGRLVLDADALNLLSLHPEWKSFLLGRPFPAVLTPHPAEAARLLKRPVPELLEDPVAAARELTEAFHAVTVFKTATPVITAPDGRAAVSIAGHAGMATGGAGDALAGALTARLAESEEPFAAACQAVRAHAHAGDIAGANGHRGMSVTDLIAALPHAWEEME